MVLYPLEVLRDVLAVAVTFRVSGEVVQLAVGGFGQVVPVPVGCVRHDDSDSDDRRDDCEETPEPIGPEAGYEQQERADDQREPECRPQPVPDLKVECQPNGQHQPGQEYESPRDEQQDEERPTDQQEEPERPVHWPHLAFVVCGWVLFVSPSRRRRT